MTVSMATTRLSSVITGCGGNDTTCSRRSISGFTRAPKGTISVSPGSGVREWRPSRSTIPARACGTIRTPAAATMNTNRARTIRAIRPAVIRTPSLAPERCRAPDLEHVHPRARLDDFVVVVGARGPDLDVQPDATDALGVGDALDDGRGLAHQGRGARPQLALRALMLAGDRAQRREQDHGDDQERRPLDRRARSQRGQKRRHERAAGERRQEQAHGSDLAKSEDHRGDQPEHPGIHVLVRSYPVCYA